MTDIDEMCELVRDVMRQVNERQPDQPKADRPQVIPKPTPDELEKRRLMRQIEEWRREGF